MIDWTRVCELRDEIGAEDFAEVVALFLEEADEVVAQLAACTGAGALEAALHFLKGSALNLGFSTLAQLCKDGERHAAQGGTLIDVLSVRHIYDASKAEFEAGLDRLGGERAA